MADGGLNLYSPDQCQTLNERLAIFPGGRILVLTAEPVYKCPAAPYEAALLIDWRLRKKKVRSISTIEVYAAEPSPMGTAGIDVSEAIKQMLAQRDIAYFPGHQVVSVQAAQRQIAFANGKTVVSTFSFMYHHTERQKCWKAAVCWALQVGYLSTATL